MSNSNDNTVRADEVGFVPAGIMSEVVGTGKDKVVPARLTKKFEPKSWKPVYDLMVFHSCMGVSNKEIAEKYNYTPQQVCNILVSNQGRVRKKLILANLIENETASVQDRMEKVATKFLQKIELVADNDELFEKAPFAFVDRGLAIIKGLGRLEGDRANSNGGSSSVHNTQINNNNSKTFIVSEKAASELRDAIKFSDEAAAQHETPSEAIEVKLLPEGNKK
jgi:hypothetical protein